MIPFTKGINDYLQQLQWIDSLANTKGIKIFVAKGISNKIFVMIDSLCKYFVAKGINKQGILLLQIFCNNLQYCCKYFVAKGINHSLANILLQRESSLPVATKYLLIHSFANILLQRESILLLQISLYNNHTVATVMIDSLTVANILLQQSTVAYCNNHYCCK